MSPPDARDAAALTDAIAGVLGRRLHADDVSSVAHLSDLGWSAFARLADVPAPTLATKANVLVLLRKRIANANAEALAERQMAEAGPNLRVVEP